MSKINTICEICYSPTTILSVSDHRHDSSVCSECWQTHLKIRATEFGDLKCLKQNCDEQVSSQFAIECLKIDPLVVSDWKKNAMRAFQSRLNNIKNNFSKFECFDENCKQPLFKKSKGTSIVMNCLLAYVGTMTILYAIVLSNECQNYSNCSDKLKPFMTHIVTQILGSLAFIVMAIYCFCEPFFFPSNQTLLVCCNGHVQQKDLLEVENTIVFSTQPCPRCNARIERFAGCRQVTCAECKTDFCFNCCFPLSKCTCILRIAAIDDD